ncbi:MAG TPA: FadR/GntR family transcriptional regulator [Chloroflexia bacterium]|nr:FadR/GntR family transcriptional regulator [Chloroflexia bacterium]
MENSLGLPYYAATSGNAEPNNNKEVNGKTDKVSMRLDALKVPRASELVADKLRSLIVDGVVQPGATLPPEKELVSQLGVSRATLREALRILEAEGLILTKTGPRGGIVVQRPGSANLTRSLSLLLQLEETPFSVILESRHLLEPLCANLAAERITPEELADLTGSLERMRQYINDINSYVREQFAFHMGVIAAAHNDVLRLYTTSVGEIISARTTQVGLSLEERQEGIKAAESILAALESRNGALAARRVELHLRAFEPIIEKEK